MNSIPPSELICNADGSIYHLHLRPEHIADTIITVGDPDRVADVSRYFDRIEYKNQKREFVAHTGYLGNKHLMVISTGIGTDNIDIVLNELDALANIDLETRTVRPQHHTLCLIRIGTSGSLQPHLPVGSFLASAFACGFDNLMQYYHWQPNAAEQAISNLLPVFDNQIKPYIAQADPDLLVAFSDGFTHGITGTFSGFYGPQGRSLRLQPRIADMLEQLQQVQHPLYQFTNLEMETAGIYALSRLLQHRAVSLNVILANRPLGQFSANPHADTDRLIRFALEKIAEM